MKIYSWVSTEGIVYRYWKYFELVIIIYSNIREMYSKFSQIKQNLIVILAMIAMFGIFIKSSTS